MASLRKCIEAKCKDCTYDPKAGGGWREQVELCRVKSCPLWEVRPISSASLIAKRAEKAPVELDLDAIVAGLEDEGEEEIAV